jgi:hypothetical protein
MLVTFNTSLPNTPSSANGNLSLEATLYAFDVILVFQRHTSKVRYASALLQIRSKKSEQGTRFSRETG